MCLHFQNEHRDQGVGDRCLLCVLASSERHRLIGFTARDNIGRNRFREVFQVPNPVRFKESARCSSATAYLFLVRPPPSIRGTVPS
jgi:hypothetical protein